MRPTMGNCRVCSLAAFLDDDNLCFGCYKIKLDLTCLINDGVLELTFDDEDIPRVNLTRPKGEDILKNEKTLTTKEPIHV